MLYLPPIHLYLEVAVTFLKYQPDCFSHLLKCVLLLASSFTVTPLLQTGLSTNALKPHSVF